MNKKDQYDIAIIGAGIVGSALAYKLSSYSVKTLLLERSEDVGGGATKANSGIVHGGYAAKQGTLKSRLSLAGNIQFDNLSEHLGFPFQRCGSYVLAFNEDEEATLSGIRENGRLNGVEGLEIISGKELRSREQRISEEATAALYSPGAGIVSPYEAAIAMAETAVGEGVDLFLHSEVQSLEKGGNGFSIATSAGEFRASVVINAAGVFSGEISRMFGEADVEIIPKKGQYVVFQRGASRGLNSVIFQCPTPASKGILVTPTTWGNLLVGPDAQEIGDPLDRSTDYESIRHIIRTGLRSVPDINLKQAIRTYSGVRPMPANRDFIIRRGLTEGSYQAAGIESPGLTAAPAIADMLIEMLKEDGVIGTGESSQPEGRKTITMPAPLQPFQEIKEQVNYDPGNPRRIVCRCEQVREATIMDALSRPIPVDSMDAVKRRTRAGMGGCQGAFCGPRVTKILEEHLEKTRREENQRAGNPRTEPLSAHKSDPELLKQIRNMDS